MKPILPLKWLLCTLVSLTFFWSCGSADEPEVIPEPTKFVVENFVSGLNHPIGASLDSKGNLWVTDAGTGSDDASIVMITPAGEKTNFVIGLPSVLANGSIEGMSHPVVQGTTLYFLHGIGGILYKADIGNFAKGAAAVPLTSLQTQDIRTFVDSQNLVEPLNSNGYDLAIGPDNDIFFTDAGSNAIIRRKGDGTLSVFARIPDINGGDAVPTGIIWNGNEFFVTSLTGFPFAPGAAKIFKVDKNGTVSEHKTGLSLLTAVALTAGNNPIATQLGVFSPTGGFGATDGKVVDQAGNVLAEGFGMPTDLVKKNDRSYYVVNYMTGRIDQLSF